jgi:PKD repeat protein
LILFYLADVNQKPKADAGGNFEVELPINAVIVNGSKSKDDWAIVKWKWTRDDKSLAVGKVAEKSDESPILILTDVIAGKYIFNLTVFDEQGLSDTDTVTVVVKSDPKLLNLVEITIDVNSRHLTNAQYNTLTGKLALLVIDGSKLKVSIKEVTSRRTGFIKKQ